VRLHDLLAQGSVSSVTVQCIEWHRRLWVQDSPCTARELDASFFPSAFSQTSGPPLFVVICDQSQKPVIEVPVQHHKLHRLSFSCPLRLKVCAVYRVFARLSASPVAAFARGPAALRQYFPARVFGFESLRAIEQSGLAAMWKDEVISRSS